MNDNIIGSSVALLVTVFSVTSLLVCGISYVDYLISSEAVVAAINKQCNTNYERIDYLRIGRDAMLRMCETREKRIDLKR